MHFKLRSDSSVPSNACGIKLAQDVLLWCYSRCWWGGGLVSTLVLGVVFLISLKHTEIVPRKKKSQNLFPVTPFSSLSTHCNFSFSFSFLNYKIYIAYNLSL